MKKKITEVQNYFADKLARGLYKVKSISQHTIEVTVDRKYGFTLWTANGERHFEIYSDGSFMTVHFTNTQKKSGYRIASKRSKGWIDSEERKSELRFLKRLKEKYPNE